MADAGLWLYDTAGNEVFGAGTSNVTVLGSFSTGSVSGSITNDMLLKGKPIIVSALAESGTSIVAPTITAAGNKITWTFRLPSGNTPHRVVYGVRG